MQNPRLRRKVVAGLGHLHQGVDDMPRIRVRALELMEVEHVGEQRRLVDLEHVVPERRLDACDTVTDTNCYV